MILSHECEPRSQAALSQSFSLFVLLLDRMPIYVMDQHFGNIRSAFPYLCKSPEHARSFVPNIDWRVFNKGLTHLLNTSLSCQKKIICQICILPQSDITHIEFDEHLKIEMLPVWHGADYLCCGFAFGGQTPDSERLVYLSDVSAVPEETMARILSQPTHVLIIDCLRREPQHPVHVTLDEVSS